MGENGQPQLQTGLMGGVDTITRADLRAMQTAPYILHARGGKLTRVPVEKSLLPHDPKGNDQAISLALAPGGTVYVNQPTTISKSTDGGRTWTTHSVSESGSIQVLADGTFIHVPISTGPGARGPAEVRTSRDEGRTWQTLTEIEIDLPVEHSELYRHRSLTRLPDDTVLWTVEARGVRYAGGDRGEYEARYVSGGQYLFLYRSMDGGRTWDGPWPMQTWGSEGGTIQLPSGRLLATVRYGRALLPTDPADLLERTGGMSNPYKHVRLNESGDGGRTWENLRLLTTVFGQCYGFPAALSDGTVVVIHDSRYGPGGARPPKIPLNERVPSPGVPSGRAMISRDEGRTWEDEVYYAYYGDAESGYSQSVVLEDGTVLTVAGTSDYPPSGATTGNTDLTAIRWRPVAE